MIEMRSISRVISRVLFRPRIFPASTASISPREIVDEEACPVYNPKYFYPAKPGEILSNHYQLLVKIGWGTRSTVWLARDNTRYRWQSERFITLKIINNRDADDADHERDIEEHIGRQTVSHRGRGIVRTCLESFEVVGPVDRHLCLVYEPLREPLWILQKRFVNQKLPLPIAKAYIFILLAGLDFLHSECKLDNILMTFENEDILPKFIKEHSTTMPIEYKLDSDTNRAVYRCHNDFGPLDWRELRKMIPKIADFGLASRLHSEMETGEEVGIYPIQPDPYRAPEVVLGCGWGFSADIWNFGVLIWNILERTDLFCHVYDSQGRYDAKAHIAEMIGLLGPPPKELLDKSNAMAQHKWPNFIQNDAGKHCSNMRDFFGGPFFDDKGNFLHDELVPARSLKDTIPSLEEDERQAFLSFVSQMLTWLPKERKTARQLMEHPFLNGE
ncbi:uncharacterized protein TRUGW13939_08299 [Talaromyces rugulosus]|uniref:non-specific serine/threonine protein kinase n=1 Tax=Talaromyces rugulosus TaxID=121627 RepID=A0A7H8R486_TALRU|nr:uncharacterized protein TRUGW13939_08299 [Talaromyces rugulosus]QKX61152.1 hypothetical protein TRUGW13939_08299 [Talaromyces rugulosus]